MAQPFRVDTETARQMLPTGSLALGVIKHSRERLNLLSQIDDLTRVLGREFCVSDDRLEATAVAQRPHGGDVDDLREEFTHQITQDCRAPCAATGRRRSETLRAASATDSEDQR